MARKRSLSDTTASAPNATEPLRLHFWHWKIAQGFANSALAKLLRCLLRYVLRKP